MQQLDGHIIRADKAVSEGDFDGPTCIFLGDLPFNCSDEAVHEALSHFGKVLGVRLGQCTMACDTYVSNLW